MPYTVPPPHGHPALPPGYPAAVYPGYPAGYPGYYPSYPGYPPGALNILVRKIYSKLQKYLQPLLLTLTTPPPATLRLPCCPPLHPHPALELGTTPTLPLARVIITTGNNQSQCAAVYCIIHPTTLV